jgi:hypothetical protein
LSANCDGAPGAGGAPTGGPRRTAEDFAGPSAHPMATAPEAPWLCIVAQLNMHQSEVVVRLVAEAWGITEARGEKENRGLWQSMPTRAECLRDVSHRIRFLSTPQPTSWLHHIERWFRIVVRRLLKRGHCTSVEDLRERLLAVIADCNKTMAKPFKWTYKGRPLTV